MSFSTLNRVWSLLVLAGVACSGSTGESSATHTTSPQTGGRGGEFSAAGASSGRTSNGTGKESSAAGSTHRTEESGGSAVGGATNGGGASSVTTGGAVDPRLGGGGGVTAGGFAGVGGTAGGAAGNSNGRGGTASSTAGGASGAAGNSNGRGGTASSTAGGTSGAAGNSNGRGGTASSTAGGTHGGASGACGEQLTRLRVTNHCSEPLWLQHSENISDPQSVHIAPAECYDYAIPDARLESTRVWAKTGCDTSGANCKIGQSVAPCPTGGCQPPIESKFEATFADPRTCPTSGAGADCLTWYNASQVDGYTLPFRIRPLGVGSDEPGCVESDCSQLDLAQCPSHEDLSEGTYSSYASVDLRVFDPSDSTQVIGCLSPCKKLNYPAPWGLGLAESNKPTVDFCCPTPPISSQQCGSGPVASSAYVTRMHQMCPSVYSYAYDDAAGLHTCPAQTKFEVVFCP